MNQFVNLLVKMALDSSTNKKLKPEENKCVGNICLVSYFHGCIKSLFWYAFIYKTLLHLHQNAHS